MANGSPVKLRQHLLTVLSKTILLLYVMYLHGMGVCVHRMESCIVPSIPASVENKQLPPPSEMTAFGVPVFEAHKGTYCTMILR